MRTLVAYQKLLIEHQRQIISMLRSSMVWQDLTP
jgi:hypothetical protein